MCARAPCASAPPRACPASGWRPERRGIAAALALDVPEPESHRIMGAIRMKPGDVDAARRFHARANDPAPNDVFVIGRCAAFETFDGAPEQALELLDRAEALDPFLSIPIAEARVTALHALGRFDGMRAIARSPSFPSRRASLHRCSARVIEADLDRARAMTTRTRGLDPVFAEAGVRAEKTRRDPALTEALVDRLILAGLPRDADLIAAAQ